MSVAVAPAELPDQVPADPLRPARSRTVLFGAMAVLLATFVQLVRGPGVPVWRGVFGEDGGIFLTQAVASRGWGSLFTPYQGYVQFVPRLLAEVIAGLPLSWAAIALAATSAVFVSLLAAFVYRVSREVLRGRWARLAVAVAPVLLPAGFETNANITDLHWYLDYACFWALAPPLRIPRWAVAGAAVAALAMLSDPLAGFFVPLAAWQAWQAVRARERMRLIAPCTFAAAGVLQVLLGIIRQHPDHFLAAHLSDLGGIYGLRVAGSFLFGDRYLADLFRTLGWPFVLGCLGIVAIGFAAAARPRANRGLVLLAGCYSLVWLAIPLMLRGTEHYLNRSSAGLGGSRYMVNPVLFLIVAGAAALDATARRRVIAVASLAFAVIAALSFRLPAQRATGPVWTESLTAARQVCLATSGAPHEGGRSAEAPWGLAPGADDVLVPVAPGGPRPPWSVVVPCRRLVGASAS
jgi:hypothetical protein